MLQLAIFDSPAGDLLIDASALAHDVSFTTNAHGFAALTAQVDLPLDASFPAL